MSKLVKSLSKELKKYEKYMTDFNKKKKVQKDKHYSSFWWDDDWMGSSNNRFGGLSDDIKTRGSSDVVKLIKLTSYQRAIANFVKIVTKQEIPVVFGTDKSMTNGKVVVLASDISDKNFDVSVGLALHEASHIKLTDFETFHSWIKRISLDYNYSTSDVQTLKTLFNIIEDRRIDNYIFKSSPGYRAYYHKMYDHYFHSDAINKALVSKEFRDPTNTAHYLFRIGNMTNPLTSKRALPGLEDIFKMINVGNIGRLQTTQEVIELATNVYEVIRLQVSQAISDRINPDQNQSADQKGSGDDTDQKGNGDDSNRSNDSKSSNTSDDMNDEMGNGSMNLDDMDIEGDESSESGSGDIEGDGNGDVESTDGLPELDAATLHRVQKAWDEQKQFINDNVKKKETTKKLQKELQEVSKLDLDVQMVGDENKGHQCIIYDLSNKLYLRNVVALCKKYHETNAQHNREEIEAIAKELHRLTGANVGLNAYNAKTAVNAPRFLLGDNSKEIAKGLELGALLGRKLQVRNEERSLVHNRLVTGHIDNKRLSHAGYGIETVFKQIHIDRYKQACLHISLDLSSSMSGTKWEETLKMCTAIVKAATYVQNLRVQVSLRATECIGTTRDTPMLALAYDSKHNDMKHYVDVMTAMRPTNCTPEGLCFDALMRKNMLIPTSSECTSYFLNISDGAPGMGGWGGDLAVRFTRKQVQKMKNELGINILSFFVEEGSRSNTPTRWFTEMYGKDSKVVDANNVTQIARALNEKFLAEGKYTT